MPRLIESQPKKKLIWHNVKSTPPGTVKMLTAMSEEIERYFQSKGAKQ